MSRNKALIIRSTANAALLAAALLLSACASLRPDQRPEEVAASPAEAPLWSALSEIRDDNWNILLNDGLSALDWRLTAIDSATGSLDLQTFLWDQDTVGAAVMNHLLVAADRGVAVRLLVDDSFLIGEDDVLAALVEHPNISYRVFNPYYRRGSDVVSREALNLGDFDRLNHRMHNKLMVVDNRVAIVGGRNLADEYFGLHDAANFRDMELLVGGPVVQELSAAFDSYWNDIWSVPIEQVAHLEADFQRLSEVAAIDRAALPHDEADAEERTIRWETALRSAVPGDPRLLVDKPPEANLTAQSSAPVQVAQELTDILERAEEEVIIISAYLIPTPKLTAILERAARRGVRVRILTNSIRSNNHITAHSAYRNHIAELLSGGAELHEVRVDARDRSRYMQAPTEDKHLALHAKALVIDADKIFIGSANLDPRSMRINTEIGLMIVSSELNQQLRDNLEPDMVQANAWQLELDGAGRVVWVADGQVLSEQPAASYMQRIEDWFFAHMPIEEQM